MNRRATVRAPSNIAFIKYWGARDLARALPFNPSISMTLSECVSRSTAEAIDDQGADEILLRDAQGELTRAPDSFARRCLAHLDTLRAATGHRGSFRIATENSFPAAAGIASSASGFAALTLAVVRCLGLDLPTDRLSSLARASGSGSAARSVLGGFVEWPAPRGTAGDRLADDESSYAVAVAPYGHWHLCDVVTIVEAGPKEVSSLDGHRRAPTSPYFERRLELLPRRLERARRAIAERDFTSLGPLLEEEAIDLHLIAMSSAPPIFYWSPDTLAVLAELRRLRAAGCAVWATMDAGANVHAICEPENEERVAHHLGELPGVQRLIRDRVGPGPREEEEHLL